ncbi:MAG: hypothetical protein DLM57_16790 [Pseudonocardiales bacterium]|nr:MAG: hypothetical protein DLM57_16790 [Pseudonocardiales bacterium]
MLGLVFVAAMTLLCRPMAWRIQLLAPVQVAGAVVGVIVALVLVWVELFRVDATCLYCAAVHICSLVLLGAVLWTTSELRNHDATRDQAIEAHGGKGAA